MSLRYQSEDFRYSYKELKAHYQKTTRIQMGDYTIAHDNRNVYINGKMVLHQCSYGTFITKRAWSAHYNRWVDFNDSTVQKNTDFCYLKNIERFFDMLDFINLKDYMDSIENNHQEYLQEHKIYQY